MADAEIPPDLQAALDLWECLAARAWSEYRLHGRGLLIVDRGQLLAAATRARAGESPDLNLTWFRADHMPPTDAYHALACSYDPNQQVLLLVGESENDENLYVIEAKEGERPRPRECGG